MTKTELNSLVSSIKNKVENKVEVEEVVNDIDYLLSILEDIEIKTPTKVYFKSVGPIRTTTCKSLNDGTKVGSVSCINCKYFVSYDKVNKSITCKF